MAAAIATPGCSTPTGGRVLRSAGLSMVNEKTPRPDSTPGPENKDKAIEKKPLAANLLEEKLVGKDLVEKTAELLGEPDASTSRPGSSASLSPSTSASCASASDGAVVKRVVGMRSRKLTIDTKISSMLGKDINGGLAEMPHPANSCCSPGPVASVWGGVSDQDQYQPFFGSKSLNFHRLSSFGDLPHDIGVHCQRGQKPSAPNQDDFWVLQKTDWLLCGVADGHGVAGHEVSHFVQENLPQSFLGRYKSKGDWRSAVHSAFEEVIEKMKSEIPTKCQESGATASMVMLGRDRKDPGTYAPLKLRTSYVGDSQIVLAKKESGSSAWEIEMVTETHRPDREDELERIRKAKGQVSPAEGKKPPRLRVPSGDIAMSRALGDIDAQEHGLTWEPEILDDIILQEDAEHIILICSDGVWDMFEPREAVSIVAKFAADDSQRAAERLAQKAQSRWQQKEADVGVIDDITVIVIRPGAAKVALSSLPES
eukprot:TRINITY_DN33439_c0_g1_i1.p1 TRINITY_DN33439_c0_g1~~TRINITY_DN33439_c0_g1_i1.p1  ORF type:complete len:483 (-),score=103.32 TRINITY_DN33439_c0_g1_i1:36-1484(-)